MCMFGILKTNRKMHIHGKYRPSTEWKGQGFHRFSVRVQLSRQSSFWNWRTGLYVLDFFLYEQCASTKTSTRELSEEWAQRQRKVDLGQIEKKQKAQLLAKRSVEGSSRLGLIRLSWKSAGFGCAGSAAMAPGSVLSTYTTIFFGGEAPLLSKQCLLGCCYHVVSMQWYVASG